MNYSILQSFDDPTLFKQYYADVKLLRSVTQLSIGVQLPAMRQSGKFQISFNASSSSLQHTWPLHKFQLIAVHISATHETMQGRCMEPGWR